MEQNKIAGTQQPQTSNGVAKTHIDKLRNPNYLGGWDLLDANGITIDKIVTIKEIKNEMVFSQNKQSEEQVLTIFFNECKPVILNSTNRKMLKKVLATDFVEEMIGKKIILTTQKIKAFGEVHDAIRISRFLPKKPVLTIGSDDFNKCKDYLQKGGVLDSVKKRYDMSLDVEIALTDKSEPAKQVPTPIPPAEPTHMVTVVEAVNLTTENKAAYDITTPEPTNTNELPL